MVRQRHPLSGHEFEQITGDGGLQRSLECCSSWNHRESDMDTTLLLNSSNNPVPSHPSQIPGTRLSLTLLSPLFLSVNEDLFCVKVQVTKDRDIKEQLQIYLLTGTCSCSRPCAQDQRAPACSPVPISLSCTLLIPTLQPCFVVNTFS